MWWVGLGRSFWRDESGSFLEYLVPLLVVGLGAVPIVAGLNQSLQPVVENTQEQVLAFTESGY